MKKYWKAIAVAAAAGILVYPAMKLYQYVAKKRAEGKEDEGENEHPMKHLGFIHHSQHKPHHRKMSNGHVKA